MELLFGNSVLLVIVFFIISMLLIDLIPQFYTWQSRIHIGRIHNKELWKKKILQKSMKWLANTPSIKLTDNSRLIIIDILRGNYKRDAIQHWQQAALLLGLTQQYNSFNDEKVKYKIDNFINRKLNSTGNWNKQPEEIDGVILAYAIINIPWINHDKFKPSYDAIYKMILNLKGDDGTIAYKKHNADYRFVDTIGFICPFLVSYGIKFDVEEAVLLGIKQISEFNKYGMLEDRFIPCHTYKITDKLPVGLFGWGRGLGWYAIGLIDSWSAMPKEHCLKEELTQNIIRFSKTILNYQNDNGSFNWIIMAKESRLDSSTTVTLAWFLANASSIEIISTTCLEAKNKALNFLMSVTRRDGAIDFSQGDTKAIGVHSQEFDILPFAQGFALRTISYNTKNDRI